MDVELQKALEILDINQEDIPSIPELTARYEELSNQFQFLIENAASDSFRQSYLTRLNLVQDAFNQLLIKLNDSEKNDALTEEEAPKFQQEFPNETENLIISSVEELASESIPISSQIEQPCSQLQSSSLSINEELETENLIVLNNVNERTLSENLLEALHLSEPVSKDMVIDAYQKEREILLKQSNAQDVQLASTARARLIDLESMIISNFQDITVNELYPEKHQLTNRLPRKKISNKTLFLVVASLTLLICIGLFFQLSENEKNVGEVAKNTTIKPFSPPIATDSVGNNDVSTGAIAQQAKPHSSKSFSENKSSSQSTKIKEKVNQKKIEDLEWDAVKSSNSLEKIELFLTNHPRTTHYDEAQKLIVELQNKIQILQLGGQIDQNGQRYDYYGECRNSIPHGKGKATFHNGDIYEGYFSNGKENGQGARNYKSGNKYAGEWKDGKLNGKGTYYWANGDKYEGYWLNGVQHGTGTFIQNNGNKYVGEFSNGKRNGKGIFTETNGDSYDGEWKNDQRHGFGIFIKSGAKNIKSCLMAKKYEGQWQNDKKVGIGKCFDKNGRLIYEGGFKDDKPSELYPNRR